MQVKSRGKLEKKFRKRLREIMEEEAEARAHPRVPRVGAERGAVALLRARCVPCSSWRVTRS